MQAHAICQGPYPCFLKGCCSGCCTACHESSPCPRVCLGELGRQGCYTQTVRACRAVLCCCQCAGSQAAQLREVVRHMQTITGL